MSDAQREAMPQPVTWVCTRRLSGDKRVLDEPCFASNPAYVKAHPDYDWTPLYVRPIQPQGAASPQGARLDAENAKPLASNGRDQPESLPADISILLQQAAQALETHHGWECCVEDRTPEQNLIAALRQRIGRE